MAENDQAKILWDFQIKTDKLVMSNQPDIVAGKQRNTAVVIDVAMQNNCKIRKKENTRSWSHLPI